MGYVFATFRNAGHVFPHGKHSMEQPMLCFPNMANVSSRQLLLAPGLAEMAKCVGGVDPSSSWTSDVIVCDKAVIQGYLFIMVKIVTLDSHLIMKIMQCGSSEATMTLLMPSCKDGLDFIDHEENENILVKLMGLRHKASKKKMTAR
ncbi:hypothetical protein BTVI_61060 [Pitangus sulphuratus]|nr:hypothetical protein BTVI_61060 [Pitangus sulphuratus]